MKVIEIDEGKSYIVVNLLHDTDGHLEFSQNKDAEHILLYFVLAHVFMADESKEGG